MSTDRALPQGRLLVLDASMLEAAPDDMEIVLRGHEQILGRERGCSIPLRSPTLSRRHARLFAAPGGWGVEDLRSTNGIFVNGRRVTAAWLNDGDELRVGPVPFRYHADEGAAPALPEPADAELTMLAAAYLPAAEPVRRLRRRLLAYGRAAGLRDQFVSLGLEADYDVLVLDALHDFVEHLVAVAPSLVLIGLTETPDDVDAAIEAVRKETPTVPVALITDRPFNRVRAVMALAEQHHLAMLQPLPYPCAADDLTRLLAGIPTPEAPLSAADLAAALRERQLVVHFQPKVDLRRGETVGAEALVRWRHPERGTIPPDRFIPLAEQSGQVTDLTYFVIAETLAVIRRLQARGWALDISVNVSARTLVDLGFIRQVTAMMEQAGVPPQRITFEVTESTAMLRATLIRDVLADMRRRGFGISLDDFGTGYSTLEELHRMPFSELKVDKQFVIALLTDAGAAAITESTINLAHNLGLAVVAEGVETREVYEKLRGMGCDLAQGYFISRPLPAHELEAWLSGE